MERKRLYWIIGISACIILSITLGLSLGLERSPEPNALQSSGSSVLLEVPLIDGHNDLPHNLYGVLENRLDKFNFDSDLTQDPIFGPMNNSHTDLPRLRKGRVGGQFWVAYVSCKTQHKDAVARTMQQIDVIKRLIRMYPNDLHYATNADGALQIMDAFRSKKIASLIVIEGGHSIDDRLSVLRLYYEMGVRYMTLTHSCNQPWVDASPIDAEPSLAVNKRNLTEWGKNVIYEMNRLGMMVDLSHVSYGVMHAVLDIAQAPVMFSHSSSYAVYPHHRNVKDDVLLRVRDNGGVVMVNFYSAFVAGVNSTIYDVMRHINHIRKIAGVDHVGIGGDYDGVDEVPVGLEDVSTYPLLFDLLASPDEMYTDFTPWTSEELKKLAGKNILRVMRAVEQKSGDMSALAAIDEPIPEEEVFALDGNQTCKTDFKYAGPGKP